MHTMIKAYRKRLSTSIERECKNVYLSNLRLWGAGCDKVPLCESKVIEVPNMLYISCKGLGGMPLLMLCERTGWSLEDGTLAIELRKQPLRTCKLSDT